MAKGSKRERKSPYTADRGMAGAFEGETITRRGLFTGGAMAAGGIATAAFALPSLGFALGPIFENQTDDRFQDVGPVDYFNELTYVPVVVTSNTAVGEAGKTTVYVRKAVTDPVTGEITERSPSDTGDKQPQPYVAISTRCAHLGCPVRYVQASQRFICPCHGGVYDFQGKVSGGPPVRPLDRYFTRVENGRVAVGKRFSVNSELERFAPRDPSEHVDGLWQYLYPSRPTAQ